MNSTVLRLATKYLTHPRQSGDTLRARCPYCDHQRAFLLSLDHGGWCCFRCARSGAFLTLLRVLGAAQQDQEAVKKDLIPSKRVIRRKPRLRGGGRQIDDEDEPNNVLPEYLLGAYDQCPVSLLEAGFEEEILQEHQIGFDVVHDRITFPVRDIHGRLVAVSGRAMQNWKEPRYKVYTAKPPDPQRGIPAGELHGIVDNYEPRNRDVLYGIDTVYPLRTLNSEALNDPLIIVEGYKGCLWMRQCGFRQALGLQGSSLSTQQLELLSKLPGPYYVLLDWEPGKQYPDNFGHCAALKIEEQLRRYGRVLLPLYPGFMDDDPHHEKPPGTSPDDLTAEELVEMIRQAKTAAQLEIGVEPMTTSNARRAFRRTKQKSAALTKDSGKTEYGPWGLKHFSMDIGEAPARIRILDPGPEGFLTLAQHKTHGYRTHTCTEDLPGFEGRCVYCHYWGKADKGSEDRKNLFPTIMTALELIDYRYFHIVEESVKGEKKKVLKRCGFDDAVPRPGRGRKCKYCESHNPQEAERIFGGRKIWEMSTKRRESLFSVNNDLGAVAFLQREDGSIEQLEAYTVGLRCSNPQCNEVLLDEEQFNEMADEDMEAALSTEATCEVCGTVDLPEELWIAVDGDGTEYPMDTEGLSRATLFDKDIEVSCSGTLSQDKKRTFREFSFDKSKYDFGHPADTLIAHGLDEVKIEDILRPIDLMDQLYRPEFLSTRKFEGEDGKMDVEAYVQAVLAKQAEILEKKNPFATEDTSTRSQPYSNGRSFRRR